MKPSLVYRLSSPFVPSLQPQSTQLIALLFRLLGESGNLIAVRLISTAVIDSPCHLFSSVLFCLGIVKHDELGTAPMPTHARCPVAKIAAALGIIAPEEFSAWAGRLAMGRAWVEPVALAVKAPEPVAPPDPR